MYLQNAPLEPASVSGKPLLGVENTLDYESWPPASRAPVALVADNLDAAGDFEANAEEIAAGLLASRNPGRFTSPDGELSRPGAPSSKRSTPTPRF
jgi:hypothetical protein